MIRSKLRNKKRNNLLLDSSLLTSLVAPSQCFILHRRNSSQSSWLKVTMKKNRLQRKKRNKIRLLKKMASIRLQMKA